MKLTVLIIILGIITIGVCIYSIGYWNGRLAELNQQTRLYSDAPEWARLPVEQI